MRISGVGLRWLAVAVAALACCGGACLAQTAGARIDDALQNITTLVRPGQVGYATAWDGNKYVQCRRIPGRDLRCEAAGTSMQPSLANVLTVERLSRLAALGWVLDPAFGNYVQTFPADMPTPRVADHILQTLTEAYDAGADDIEILTEWIDDVPCPPRNGPTQNLAGIINDAPSMRATAVTACSYEPPDLTPPPGYSLELVFPRGTSRPAAGSAAAVIARYGAAATGEIQRLRINAARRVWVIFQAHIGYVQCTPETPTPAIYCEAQSAESWLALAKVLTPARRARLKSAGYADPGRSPNYWKRYAPDIADADIARETLTILHDVYGFTGATKLEIKTE